MKGKRKPTYLEESRGTYLFNKRLNASKGTFPGWQDKIKKKIGSVVSMSKAEALTIAARHSADVEHLQAVCLRDSKGLDNPTKELNTASSTWFWLCGVNLEQLREEATKKTKEGLESLEAVDILMSEVTEHFGRYEERPYHPDGSLSYLTPFGDHLLNVLKTGIRSTAFSESITPYLKHTNREHLPATHRTVVFTKTILNRFISVAGDKLLEQISRKDVQQYIQHRLETVKTTSVAREVNVLRSVWNKASKEMDVRSQNPFSEQPIKGLGSDSVKRKTPTVEETRELLVALHNETHKSYVTPMIAIAALTGLRVSEVAYLESGDFDRANLVLNIQNNTRRSGLKTANSYRPFPVLPQLEVWLELFFEQNPPANNTSASAAGIKRLKKHGLEHLKNHSLRHGFKQRLVEVDTPDNMIDELLGWSSQAMRKNYGYTTITEKKRAAVARAYSHLFPQLNDSKVVYLKR